MLLPSHETQKRLEKYSTHDEIEAKALKLEWKRAVRRRRRIYGAFAGIALASITASAYMHDVQANQEIQTQASVEIDIESPALDKANDDKAILFVDGFGTNNADAITKYTGHAVQPVIDGQRWSMNLNNATIDKDKIAQEIIDTAEQQHVTTISIVTHSAGGNIMAPVIVPLIKNSELTIPSVTFDSTPYDTESLRPARQDEIELVKKLALIPGIEYSSSLRFLGELGLRSDNYTHGTVPENIAHFEETATDIKTKLDTNQLPGTRLMIDQLVSIQKTDFESVIDDISKLPDDEVKPVLIYAKTAKPGYDPIVDVDKSEEKLATDIKKANKKQKAGAISFIPLDIPGAVHTRPDLANDAYVKAFANAKNEIQSAILDEASEASLHRVTGPTYTYDPTKKPQN